MLLQLELGHPALEGLAVALQAILGVRGDRVQVVKRIVFLFGEQQDITVDSGLALYALVLVVSLTAFVFFFLDLLQQPSCVLFVKTAQVLFRAECRHDLLQPLRLFLVFYLGLEKTVAHQRLNGFVHPFVPGTHYSPHQTHDFVVFCFIKGVAVVELDRAFDQTFGVVEFAEVGVEDSQADLHELYAEIRDYFGIKAADNGLNNARNVTLPPYFLHKELCGRVINPKRSLLIALPDAAL